MRTPHLPPARPAGACPLLAPQPSNHTAARRDAGQAPADLARGPNRPQWGGTGQEKPGRRTMRRRELIAALGLAPLWTVTAGADNRFRPGRSSWSSPSPPAALPICSPAFSPTIWARTRPAGLHRGPCRRRRHDRGRLHRQEPARRLYDLLCRRLRDVRHSLHGHQDAVRLAEGFVADHDRCCTCPKPSSCRLRSASIRCRPSSPTRASIRARSISARPAPARSRISARNCSRKKPTSTSCTCPIAASRRR